MLSSTRSQLRLLIYALELKYIPMQEFTVFVAEPFPRADFFVMEIRFGTFKHLIHVHMNVFSAVKFDQSEETYISAWFQLQEAPRASYFTSDDNGFGCKCGEKNIETKRCSKT